VGLGDVCVSDSRSGYHDADTLALEYAYAKTTANSGPPSIGPIAEWGGGALNVATKPILMIAPPEAVGGYRRHFANSRPVAISDYWTLTKPEVNFLIAIATLTGFYVALPGSLVHFPWLLLLHTLLGTLLVASGTGALNQYIERHFDAQMRRTSRRPLAAGRLEPFVVLWFGIALSAVGCIYLAIAVNVLASLLSILTLLSYLFLYTPLKRKTPICTLIGAFPGAAPPLIGWAAASGKLSLEAWILYAMLFLWQFPHFMAIAWMYREDYDRAAYCVLPQGKARDSVVSLQTILPLLALFPIALLPAWGNCPSVLYATGALLLNLGFFHYGVRFVLHRSSAAARRLLLASIIYLPSVLALMSLFSGRSAGHNG
jgi:heme o synthase